MGISDFGKGVLFFFFKKKNLGYKISIKWCTVKVIRGGDFRCERNGIWAWNYDLLGVFFTHLLLPRKLIKQRG